MAASTATRAMPEGMRKVSRKSAVTSDSSRPLYEDPILAANEKAIRRARPVRDTNVPMSSAPTVYRHAHRTCAL